MECVSVWFRANNWSLNAQRNVFIFCLASKHFSNKPDINTKWTENIQRVSPATILGIIINVTLDWGLHIDYVARKITCGSYAIGLYQYYQDVFVA